jgi:prephenate dehydrogenase
MNEYSTPIYQIITDLTARMLNQKAELYGSIQNENLEIEEVRKKFIESAESVDEIIKDNKDFGKKFEQLGAGFDLEGAQERSDELIGFLSNEVRQD